MTADEVAKTTRLGSHAEFLRAEVDIGITFAGLALRCDDPARVARTRALARAAYDAVIRHREKAVLTAAELHDLSMRLARLKSELQTLGESI